MIAITSFRNRPNFFARIRVVAAGYIEHANGLRDESPIYDECPSHCDVEQGPRSEYCAACPIGNARDEYREQMRAELADMPGPQYGFEYLERCVIENMRVGELDPAQITVATARIRGLIEYERQRIARVRDWNREQAAANAG